MIKTIIFDNNGVLTTSDREDTLDKISGEIGVPVSKLIGPWLKKAKKLDEGKISNKDFIREILEYFGKEDYDFEKIYQIYKSAYHPKQEVRDLASKLKKEYEIALLTNFGEAFDEFNKKWKMENLFDENKIFVSAYLKMRKPKKEIFEYVLDNLGRKPEEALFIDDNKENIEAAKNMGMNAILYKDLENLKQELKNILEYSYV